MVVMMNFSVRRCLYGSFGRILLILTVRAKPVPFLRHESVQDVGQAKIKAG